MWRKINVEDEDSLPEINTEVLGYHIDWVDEDYNLSGICVCFLDGEHDWTVAVWCNSCDDWHSHSTADEATEEELEAAKKQVPKGYKLEAPTSIEAPTHWMPKPTPPT